MFKQNVACATILSTTNIAGTLCCNECLFCKQHQIFIYCIIYKTSKKDSPVTYMIVGADVELSTPQKLEWGAATAVGIAEANQSGLS